MIKLKSNEKLIELYENFYLVEVTCKNGVKYKTTKEYEIEKEEKIISEGKKFVKGGYHKNGTEIHPKRKKE